MKLKPLHDWAVIKRLNAEEKTAGGIIIPDVAKERPSEGVVISIGPGKYTIEKGRLKFTPTTIKPGQRIFYSEYSAIDAELDGREFTLVREEDILGTFEEKEIRGKKTFEIELKREQALALKKESIPATTRAKAASEKKAKSKMTTLKKKTSSKTAKSSSKAKNKKTGKKKLSKKAEKAVKKTAKKVIAKKKILAKGEKSREIG